MHNINTSILEKCEQLTCFSSLSAVYSIIITHIILRKFQMKIWIHNVHAQSYQKIVFVSQRDCSMVQACPHSVSFQYTNARVITSKDSWLQHQQKKSRKWPTYPGGPLHTTPLLSNPTISDICISGEELKFQESQMYRNICPCNTYLLLHYLLFSFPDHYLGLNGLSMREAGDSTYTPSSSQPLNPNMPYSPDGMIDTSHETLRIFF